ncbi:hypothetical protein Bbelb_277060 [Branchiostoma belcheri]|nr:hypothetical protein Bbelb_277060 [Branchiostoma belcheri]
MPSCEKILEYICCPGFYRTQAEMAHTCRGTINLAGAYIDVEDSCNFVISNGGTQCYHLKASSEVERQRWVTALELAKAKAIRLMESGASGALYLQSRQEIWGTFLDPKAGTCI